MFVKLYINYIQQWIGVARQWWRFARLPDCRLNKKVFLWARQEALSGKRTGLKYCMDFFAKVGMGSFCDAQHDDTQNGVTAFDQALKNYFNRQWLQEVNQINSRTGHGGNKLRTYKLFKTIYAPEKYLQLNMSSSNRSALAKFRCGVAPIRLETGRYE